MGKMKNLCALLAILLALQPVASSAGRGGGGFHGGGGGSRGSGGGFNFSHDVPQGHPQSLNHSNAGNGKTFNGNNYNANHSNGNSYSGNHYNGNSYNGNHYNGNSYNGNRYNGNSYNGNRTNVNVHNNTYIRNPVYVNNSAWGWNHGVAWTAAPYYWGGGFWGAMAIGVTSAAVGAAVYGSVVSNNVTYSSYQVQPSSPGATFLSNYQLTQVQCGPPGLVVVYGPQNSVICANPNHLVAAGSYRLNAETLSLTTL